MGDATDSGHWSLESIATHVAREWGGETHPAERPTRRDLPRLQSRGHSLEADPTSSLAPRVVLPMPTADEVLSDPSEDAYGDADVETLRPSPK
jgi:hypothetical protein